MTDESNHAQVDTSDAERNPFHDVIKALERLDRQQREGFAELGQIVLEHVRRTGPQEFVAVIQGIIDMLKQMNARLATLEVAVVGGRPPPEPEGDKGADVTTH
jgi:hypothetical protein